MCVIKAPLLEHMLAKTNIHARHNLAIRSGFQMSRQHILKEEMERAFRELRARERERDTGSSLSPPMWRGLNQGPGISLRQPLKSASFSTTLACHSGTLEPSHRHTGMQPWQCSSSGSEQYAVGQIPYTVINRKSPIPHPGGWRIHIVPSIRFAHTHRDHPSFCLNVFSCTTRGRGILNEIIKDTQIAITWKKGSHVSHPSVCSFPGNDLGLML